MRPRIRIRVYLVIVSLVITAAVSHAQQLTLPTYRLTIESAYWDSLEANPSSDKTYPAMVQYAGDNYPCRVRYRGGTSRLLPKRSWKFIFDEEGPFGEQETNLNAEYRDISLCRNYLSMALSRIAEIPTPDTRFISLIVNDIYLGVYVEVEQVDERFLQRRDINDEVLFKTILHGARFAPTLYTDDLTRFYMPRILPYGALDSLGVLLTFIQYGDSSAMAQRLESVFDTDNFLSYFALQVAISNSDGFTKNYYLGQYSDSRHFVVPWDMDATFGNDWTGCFTQPPHKRLFSELYVQAAAQRLIAVETHRSALRSKINDLVHSGFDSLQTIITQTYNEISNDVHQDTLKLGSNSEFDSEYDSLMWYMNSRASQLNISGFFERMEIIETYVDRDYIFSVDDSIRFEAQLPSWIQRVKVHIEDSNYVGRSETMFDDGTHGDSVANDLRYTTVASFPDLTPPFYYAFSLERPHGESFTHPPAGFFGFRQNPLDVPVIHLDSNPPDSGSVSVGPFSEIQGSGVHYLCLVNRSSRSLNLSGCCVRLNRSYTLTRLESLEAVAPGDTLFVTNYPAFLSSNIGGGVIAGKLYSAPAVGDTVYFETSSGKPLSSAPVERIETTPERTGDIVINEINYNSSSQFDTEDWLELYCLQGTHNLSGWRLYDNRDDHYFELPQGTSIEAGEFLILAKNPEAFSALFPTAGPLIGGFEFGFGGDGDEVRLFTDSGALMDWVAYDDDPPWPTEPDGNGPTLELLDAGGPNLGPDNWRASIEPSLHGTPGGSNSVDVKRLPPGILPHGWAIHKVYPNPFNNRLAITFTAPRGGLVVFRVFDILGRELRRIEQRLPGAGNSTVYWDGADFGGVQAASGIYFIKLESSGNTVIRKVLLLR